VPAVDHQLRTETGTAQRWIGGYSTGAYGAANLALRHPKLFGVAVLLSVEPPGAATLELRRQRREAGGERPAEAGTAAGHAERPVLLHGEGEVRRGRHEEIVWQTGLYNGLLALGTQLGNPSQ
jgi:pimeloyl-ACP methyl ester carboxylesterase